MHSEKTWSSNQRWMTMAASDGKKMFFDTDCLSAFLWVDEQALLPLLYPGRIIIPAQVYQELSNPRVGHLKNRIDTLINSGKAKLLEIDYGSPALANYIKFTESPEAGRKIIGRGEASAIALAIENNGIVASNNLRDIAQYIQEYGLGHITTGDILTEAYNRDIITLAQAEDLWTQMLSKRRKLGAESFSEYLERNRQKD